MRDTRWNIAPVISPDSITEISYKVSAIKCANRDPHGIATIVAVATENNVARGVAWEYFNRHPDKKREWSVFDEREAKEERIRRTVARMRKKIGPHAPILRKELARELNWDYFRLISYLAKHPALCIELGIVCDRKTAVTLTQKLSVDAQKQQLRDAAARIREKRTRRKIYRSELADELRWKPSRVKTFLLYHKEMISELCVATVSHRERVKKVVNAQKRTLVRASRAIQAQNEQVTIDSLSAILKWKRERVRGNFWRHPDWIAACNLVSKQYVVAA